VPLARLFALVAIWPDNGGMEMARHAGEVKTWWQTREDSNTLWGGWQCRAALGVSSALCCCLCACLFVVSCACCFCSFCVCDARAVGVHHIGCVASRAWWRRRKGRYSQVGGAFTSWWRQGSCQWRGLMGWCELMLHAVMAGSTCECCWVRVIAAVAWRAAGAYGCYRVSMRRVKEIET